ncbi:MAG: DUF2891 domain-containing protein, partial [Actinomycetota bacterium]|nr:DUF2891 domain-containing protein [Actinomycetota bacterium]
MTTSLSRRAPARVLVAIGLAAALIVSSFASTAGASPRPRDAQWNEFLGERVKLLEELAPAFVSCFARRDSLIDPLSPIFHGCLDWHSAVHAAYSHHVLHKVTKNQDYVDLIDAQFEPHGISLIPAERAYQIAKAPDYPVNENPYGFGWFLILARERERVLDTDDLRPMADFAAEQMVSWYERRATAGDAQQYILNRRHPNYSWSLINLATWAHYTKDKALLSAVRAAAKPLRDKSLDDLCPVENDLTQVDGFQPACMMRLVAVMYAHGPSAHDWVAARVPKDLEVPEITDPPGCHEGGLNFTRAFALYNLYKATGNS